MSHALSGFLELAGQAGFGGPIVLLKLECFIAAKVGEPNEVRVLAQVHPHPSFRLAFIWC